MGAGGKTSVVAYKLDLSNDPSLGNQKMGSSAGAVHGRNDSVCDLR